MKKISNLTSIASTMAALALIAACQTVATNNAELAASKKEFLLTQSGFKVITVTTPKQQQAINGLAQYRVSAVKYNGNCITCFPLRRRTRSTSGNKSNSTPIRARSRAAGRPASEPAGSARSTTDEPRAYNDIRDCGAPAHRGRAVRWFRSDGHGVFRRLVANERSVPHRKLMLGIPFFKPQHKQNPNQKNI